MFLLFDLMISPIILLIHFGKKKKKMAPTSKIDTKPYFLRIWVESKAFVHSKHARHLLMGLAFESGPNSGIPKYRSLLNEITLKLPLHFFSLTIISTQYFILLHSYERKKKVHNILCAFFFTF